MATEIETSVERGNIVITVSSTQEGDYYPTYSYARSPLDVLAEHLAPYLKALEND